MSVLTSRETSRERIWKIMVNNLVHGYVKTPLWIHAVAQSVQFLEDGYLKGRAIVTGVTPISHDVNSSRISVQLLTDTGDTFTFGLEDVSVAYAEDWYV